MEIPAKHISKSAKHPDICVFWKGLGLTQHVSNTATDIEYPSL